MPWIDAPDPPDPVLRCMKRTLAVCLGLLFVGWALAPFAAELAGVYR